MPEPHEGSAAPGPVQALGEADRVLQEATAATAAWVMNEADRVASDSGVHHLFHKTQPLVSENATVRCDHV